MMVLSCQVYDAVVFIMKKHYDIGSNEDGSYSHWKNNVET